MTRFSKTFLMVGTAILALSACSGNKGPGAIGTKNDIVVRNNGLPQAQQQAAAPAKAPGEDFTSTVEQGEAVPAPSVETAESVVSPSPAVESAAQQVAENNAPVPSTTATPNNDLSPATAPEPAATQSPVGVVAPDQPVQATASVTPPAPEAAPAPSAVYPATDYPQAAPAPSPTPAPAPESSLAAAPSPYVYTPAPAGYQPADPNAPYSPKAAAAAAGNAAPAAAPSAQYAPEPEGALNLARPEIIRAAHAALKAKGAYNGPESGTIDANFLNALTVYQGQNKLPQGGLNEATLRHLGVIE